MGTKDDWRLSTSLALIYYGLLSVFLRGVLSNGSGLDDCRPLKPPKNGLIRYSQTDRQNGSMATLSCIPGYDALGDLEPKTCQQGRWTVPWGTSWNISETFSATCAINIAIRQEAFQSSNSTEMTILQGSRQAYESAAYLAVDGTEVYCAKTLHHTKEQPAFWSVIFKESYPVSAVKILTDSSQDVSDIQVWLLATVDRQWSDAEEDERGAGARPQPDSAGRLLDAQEPQRTRSRCTRLRQQFAPTATGSENYTLFECDARFPMRQVRVQRLTAGALRLCEVQVLSDQGMPCQHPGSPKNGIVKLSHVDWPFPPGAVAVYDCNAGFTRIPSESNFHRTCLVNGTWDADEPVCVTNVALFKVTNMSTVFSAFNLPAWQSVDGDPGSCAWSKRERQPWLEIDLLTKYTVHAVAISLDKEKLFHQFHREVFVIVSNETLRKPSSLEPTATKFVKSTLKDAPVGSGVFHLAEPLIGQFVTVFATATSERFLGICDVQVLSADELPPTPENCGLQSSPSSFLFTFKRQCYQVQRFATENWYTANDICHRNGGQLIGELVPESKRFLRNLLNGLYRYHSTDDHYWIGARLSPKPGTSQWIYVAENASTAVKNADWAVGEPSRGDNSREHCVGLGGQDINDWTWVNYRCGLDVANWICSFDARKCPDPMQPEASSLLVADKTVGLAGWNIGDVVQYECAPGYELVGSAHTICQPDGTWSNQVPRCQLIECGPPPGLSHLTAVLLNGTTFHNSQAEYYCADNNSQLIGAQRPIITCLASGYWEPLDTYDIMCEVIPADGRLQPVPVSASDNVHSVNKSASAILEDGQDIVSGEFVATASSISYGMDSSEAAGVGVGAAFALLIIFGIAAYFAIKYHRRKTSRPPTPPKQKPKSDYSTVKLNARHISAPIVHSSPDLTMQLSSTLSITSDRYSASQAQIYAPNSTTDPYSTGSVLATSSISSENTSSTYLKSLGKAAGLAALYNKAAGTLGKGTQRAKERPKVPKLVISSPIECRKTVVTDSGSTATEVIYAQPAVKVLPVQNQYEYLETNRIRGGYGYSDCSARDDGIYSDTALTVVSKTPPAIKSPVDESSEMELYDDVINHVHEVISRFNSNNV